LLTAATKGEKDDIVLDMKAIRFKHKSTEMTFDTFSGHHLVKYEYGRKKTMSPERATTILIAIERTLKDSKDSEDVMLNLFFEAEARLVAAQPTFFSALCE
jgi:hypothetical protein